MSRKSKRVLSDILIIVLTLVIVIAVLPLGMWYGLYHGSANINRSTLEAYYQDKYEGFSNNVSDALVGFNYAEELVTVAYPYQNFYINGIKWIDSVSQNDVFVFDEAKYKEKTYTWFEDKLGISMSELSAAQVEKIDNTAEYILSKYNEAIVCPWYSYIYSELAIYRNTVLLISVIALLILVGIIVWLYNLHDNNKRLTRNIIGSVACAAIIEGILSYIFYRNAADFYTSIDLESYAHLIKLTIQKGFEFGLMAAGVTLFVAIVLTINLVFNRGNK